MLDRTDRLVVTRSTRAELRRRNASAPGNDERDPPGTTERLGTQASRQQKAQPVATLLAAPGGQDGQGRPATRGPTSAAGHWGRPPPGRGYYWKDHRTQPHLLPQLVERGEPCPKRCSARLTIAAGATGAPTARRLPRRQLARSPGLLPAPGRVAVPLDGAQLRAPVLRRPQRAGRVCPAAPARRDHDRRARQWSAQTVRLPACWHAIPSRAGRCCATASILFDDTGELLPDGRVVIPHRGVLPSVR